MSVLTRTVLWHWVFWGFAINYISYINLNITIVEMIATKKDLNNSVTNELLNNISNTIDTFNGNGNKIIAEKKSLEKYIFNYINVKYESDGFQWNEYQQGLILGSFYWLHWLTQLPGGILAQKYGTKLVFGLSNVIACWLCFFIPIAAYCSYKVLIILRIIQGLIVGFTWPAMHDLTAKWIPPNERSKFVTSYYGSSIGIALSYPLFGYIMHWYSWEWSYHICGIMGTIWWLGWLTFVYDSPAQHPRISENELNYIEKSLGKTILASTHARRTPWKAILTSRPVWINVIGQWGIVWGIFTLLIQSPTYFKVIHNWDIRSTGILSGFPHIVRMIFAYIFSLFADYLLRSNKMSRTNLRKLAIFVALFLNAFFVLALAIFGQDPILAIIFITLAIMFQGAGSSGPLASMIDIAPNYAGIISGISLTISILPGFITAYLVGILTLDNQTFEAWRNVFLITFGVLTGCGITYICLADSTLQEWNDHSSNHTDDKNLQLLEKQGEKISNDNELQQIKH